MDSTAPPVLYLYQELTKNRRTPNAGRPCKPFLRSQSQRDRATKKQAKKPQPTEAGPRTVRSGGKKPAGSFPPIDGFVHTSALGAGFLARLGHARLCGGYLLRRHWRSENGNRSSKMAGGAVSFETSHQDMIVRSSPPPSPFSFVLIHGFQWCLVSFFICGQELAVSRPVYHCGFWPVTFMLFVFLLHFG